EVKDEKQEQKRPLTIWEKKECARQRDREWNAVLAPPNKWSFFFFFSSFFLLFFLLCACVFFRVQGSRGCARRLGSVRGLPSSTALFLLAVAQEAVTSTVLPKGRGKCSQEHRSPLFNGCVWLRSG
ncbi:unnamed protein product, partial [Discosporangium mesarthrocarpum]